ncbi:MAG: hypothetical protein ABI456_03960 [Ktedonobacteraceae bacterium]|nr:hypothetical protein [Chloroflexota bacterium]
MQKGSLYLLWLEGLDPERLEAVPAVMRLKARGIDVRLAPLPLVEPGQCYYQTFTGMGPGRFGRFDAVHPEAYSAQDNSDLPEGATGSLLPDVLRARGLKVVALEVQNASSLDALAGQEPDFVFMHLAAKTALAPETLDALVERCGALNSDGHLLVLTGVSESRRRAELNVNDFLADVGLLEVSEPREQGEINWPESLAYGVGTGQIWINLRGREPQGAVGSGREYQEVCDALIRELQSHWLDPLTQEPVVERVFKRDDIYAGEYLFKAPDLITVYRPGYVASANAQALHLDGESVHVVDATARDVPAPFARLIGAGPRLGHEQALRGRLIDVLPSVLYLLGQSIPQRVDGEVLLPVFAADYSRQTPIRHADEDEDMLSDEEEGLIVDRLRDLGYLG